MRKTVEICANCGRVSKEESESFHCDACGSDVCVVLPYAMFKQMVKAGLAKE